VTRIDLPDEGWAVLYAPRKVRERGRRRFVAAVADMNARLSQLPQVPNPDTETVGRAATVPDPASYGSVESGLADQVTDMLILCLVKEWSYGEVSLEILEEFDAETYDRIAQPCRLLMPELTPDYSPDVDPKAPTSASTGPPPGSSTEEAFLIPSYAPTC